MQSRVRREEKIDKDNRISRRGLLLTGGKVAIYGAAIGIAPRYTGPAWRAGILAPGMIGGPTGFPGAERYQYGADTPEGRAVEAAKALKAAGKAPTKIVLGLSDGSIGQLTQPFPEGAPSIKDLWEKETGITLEIVGLPNGQEFTKTMQDISTKARRVRHLRRRVEPPGRPRRDRRHRQARRLRRRPTGRSGTIRSAAMSTARRACRCSTSIAARPTASRSTATSRPGSTAPTCSTTRPSRRPSRTSSATTLRRRAPGSSSTRSPALLPPPRQGPVRLDRPAQPGLGLHQLVPALRLDGPRRTSSCSTTTATPLINSETRHQGDAGIRRPRSPTIRPTRSRWGWPEQYGNFANGGAAMTCAFSNLPKFLDNAGQHRLEGDRQDRLDAAAGPRHRWQASSAVRCCGSTVGMVSRSRKNPEACYLFLQWLGSSRIYAWMTANPGGYFDPFRLSDFTDPLVRETYHDYHMDVVRETVARTVPTINYPGATAFHNALDENLMAALTKAKTAEQAMADTESEWKKITRRTGQEKIAEAITRQQGGLADRARPRLTDTTPGRHLRPGLSPAHRAGPADDPFARLRGLPLRRDPAALPPSRWSRSSGWRRWRSSRLREWQATGRGAHLVSQGADARQFPLHLRRERDRT